jgi:Cof subfamily protein (haloacid dehalogenase superfamily)
MIKALFFDIDGTLVSFQTHCIPQSTIEALEAAKQNGVKIFIATGRPFSLINNLGAISHLIEGYITTNGAYSFCNDDVISCSAIDPSDVATLLRCADEMDFSSLVVGTDDIVMYNPKQEVIDMFSNLLNISKLPPCTIAAVLKQPILQLTPVISSDEEVVIIPQMPNSVSSRWFPAFTDITAKGVDKGVALRQMVVKLGFDVSETMAFGDGGNDTSMLVAAGIGVAMGNATDDVKAKADYVTSSVDANGVRDALRHFNVI